MSNALYDKGREKFLRGEISWNSDTIRVALVNTAPSGYTVDLVNDEFLDDIGSNVIAISAPLLSKTTTKGVANAGAAAFTAVAGVECEAVVLYKDSGSTATSPLIAYIDTAIGLPITPDGSDILVNWDTGDNKIFKL